MRISETRCKITLTMVFLGFLLLHFIGVGLLLVRNALDAETASKISVAIMKVYSVPLGVVLAGIYALKNATRTRLRLPPFAVALAVSAIWNLLLIARTAAFVLALEDSPNAYISQIETIAGSANFLVAGALAYYFAADPASVAR